MAQDLLTALALVLILEGLLPGLAPSTWLRMMAEVARMGTRGIRIAGITCMISGAILLQFLQ